MLEIKQIIALCQNPGTDFNLLYYRIGVKEEEDLEDFIWKLHLQYKRNSEFKIFCISYNNLKQKEGKVKVIYGDVIRNGALSVPIGRLNKLFTYIKNRTP